MTDILDQAIATSETLMRYLYSLRKFTTEKGKLDDQYKALSGGIEAAEAQRDDLQRQLEAAQADLANLARERQATANEREVLKREIADKRTELNALTACVEQIQTMLRAA